MACNVFYLKETSLDAVLVENTMPEFHMAHTTVMNKSHSGRVDVPKPGDPLI